MRYVAAAAHVELRTRLYKIRRFVGYSETIKQVMKCAKKTRVTVEGVKVDN
jgi:hypothetical protein